MLWYLTLCFPFLLCPIISHPPFLSKQHLITLPLSSFPPILSIKQHRNPERNTRRSRPKGRHSKSVAGGQDTDWRLYFNGICVHWWVYDNRGVSAHTARPRWRCIRIHSQSAKHNIYQGDSSRDRGAYWLTRMTPSAVFTLIHSVLIFINLPQLSTTLSTFLLPAPLSFWPSTTLSLPFYWPPSLPSSLPSITMPHFTLLPTPFHSTPLHSFSPTPYTPSRTLSPTPYPSSSSTPCRVRLLRSYVW